MPDFDFDQFSGKRIVLLQGPVGPFFRQLADALKAAGATVSKINFNAGDWFFFPRHAINYRGTMQAWPSWFRRFCENERVDAVLLFGDCRPIHRDAHAVAVDLGIDVGVFEEGYIRPNYVTLERHGVNGHSRLPRNAEAYHAQPACGYHEVITSYYLRMRVEDKPGVLADITRILADSSISIEALIQKEAAAGESDTDIIMLTHRTVERNANAAIAKIEVLESVQGKVTKLRVESLS